VPSVLLLADPDAGRRKVLAAALQQAGAAERVVECDSGRMLVGTYAKALRSSLEVAGVVLDTRLPLGGGKSSAIAIRAVERGMSAGPVAFVFHTADPRNEAFERLLGFIGRAGHRQRAEGAAPAGEATALVATLQEVRAA